MKSEAQRSCVTTARRVYGKKRVIPAKPTSSTLSACHQQVVAQHFTPKAGPACLDPRQVILDKGALPGELTPLSLFMLQSFPCSTVRDTSNRLLHTAFYKAHLLKFASYNHDWWLFFFLVYFVSAFTMYLLPTRKTWMSQLRASVFRRLQLFGLHWTDTAPSCEIQQHFPGNYYISAGAQKLSPWRDVSHVCRSPWPSVTSRADVRFWMGK